MTWFTLGIALLAASGPIATAIYSVHARRRDQKAEQTREDTIRAELQQLADKQEQARQEREDNLLKEHRAREDDVRNEEQDRRHLADVLREVEATLDEIEDAALQPMESRDELPERLRPGLVHLRRKLAKLPRDDSAAILYECFTMLRIAHMLPKTSLIAIFGTLDLARSVVGAKLTGGPVPDRSDSFKSFLSDASEWDKPATVTSTPQWELQYERPDEFSDIWSFESGWHDAGKPRFRTHE